MWGITWIGSWQSTVNLDITHLKTAKPGKFNTGSVLSFPLKLVHSGGFSIYLWRFSVVCFQFILRDQIITCSASGGWVRAGRYFDIPLTERSKHSLFPWAGPGKSSTEFSTDGLAVIEVRILLRQQNIFMSCSKKTIVFGNLTKIACPAVLFSSYLNLFKR